MLITASVAIHVSRKQIVNRKWSPQFVYCREHGNCITNTWFVCKLCIKSIYRKLIKRWFLLMLMASLINKRDSWAVRGKWCCREESDIQCWTSHGDLVLLMRDLQCIMSFIMADTTPVDRNVMSYIRCQETPFLFQWITRTHVYVKDMLLLFKPSYRHEEIFCYINLLPQIDLRPRRAQRQVR